MYLTPLILHRVLKKTGSFYYHCDWHASHYVKVMLDQIFGDEQFQSEVIWQRSYSHGNVTRSFGNICDSVFFYTRGAEYVWNQLYIPYNETHLTREFRRTDEKGRRFTLSDLRNPGYRPNLVYDYTASNGITYKPHPNGWAVSREVMEQYDREGRLYFPNKPNARLRLKRFLDETRGQHLQNLWNDIPAVHPMSKERLGYPTQKPLALLDRIIKASCNPNDIVLDAFCGCGTALVAAENLGRQWIGIDVSPTACRVMAKRLRDVCGIKEDEKLWRIGRGFVVRDLPWSEEQLHKIPPFEFENWAVIALGGIPNKAQVGDMGIDGRIFPVSSLPQKQQARKGETPAFDEFLDHWYPIQVKQKDRVGRPDIDAFEAMMMREDRQKGFFVAFDYTQDALHEIDAFFRKSGKAIVALTVKDILEEQIAYKLA